jgi:hypothetical protein
MVLSLLSFRFTLLPSPRIGHDGPEVVVAGLPAEERADAVRFGHEFRRIAVIPFFPSSILCIPQFLRK